MRQWLDSERQDLDESWTQSESARNGNDKCHQFMHVHHDSDPIHMTTSRHRTLLRIWSIQQNLSHMVACKGHRLVVLSCYRAIVLSYYRVVVLSYYRVVVLLYYHIVVLSYYRVVVLSYYRIIVLSAWPTSLQPFPTCRTKIGHSR